MKIKHHDVEIDQSNPFANCQLGRKPYGEILTNIAQNYADGFVMAINNEWGTGKTTFVKMWRQQLENKDFKTIYFNAWENDYQKDAMVAIMAELGTLIVKTSTIYKSLLKNGAILTKNLLPQLINAVASKYIDTEVLKKGIEGVTKAATDILEKEIGEYANKKKGMKDFREDLEKFIQKASPDKPLVFIIDELDRCRPNYAVEVLEQVKHFFSVPGIVFILALDKVQLAHAVRGVYGSDNINAEEYLRRFIDLEYTIPEPKTGDFCRYLYEYFKFDDFLSNKERSSSSELMEEGSSFLKFAEILFDNAKITLRQHEKIFSHARLIMNMFGNRSLILPNVLVLLLYLRTLFPKVYFKIIGKTLNHKEVIEEIEKVLPDNNGRENINYFIFAEAQLLYLYNNSFDHNHSSRKIRLAGINNEGVHDELIFNSKYFITEDEKNSFSQFLINNTRNPTMENVGLKYIVNKIELVDSFVR